MSESCNPARFEPSPYDLGLSGDPDAVWQDGRVAGPLVPDMTAPNGEPVYLGAAGRLVYDAEPDSANGCFSELDVDPDQLAAIKVQLEAEAEAS